MEPAILPVFETKRLILRGVTEADIPAYEKNFVDYEVIGPMSCAVPWPYPDGGVPDYLHTQIFPNQGRDRWVWAIFLKTSPDEAIGCVDLWRDGKPENRGFWLGRRYWGHGYMTEAVEPVMNYAFGVLGFERIILANAVGNDRSRRIKEKNGARLLRVEPAQFVNPDYTEHEVWVLTEEDWRNRPRK